MREANAHYPELISAYPQADLRGNQGSLYHYYIPAYLASKFADEDGNGSLARKQAAQDATLFNMSYERGHLPMWNLDFSNPVTKKDAFQDSEGQHFVGSSYLGYRGSTWATDLSDSKSINEFKSELSIDPSNLVNTIGDKAN